MKAHDEQVTISLNEEILCPHGEGHRFTLREGLAESTIRRIQQEQAETSAAEFDLQQSIEVLKAEQNLALAKAAADARELSRIEAMSLAEKTLGEKLEKKLVGPRPQHKEF